MNGAARRILLTPGPLTTSDGVKRALVGADECPREADFRATVQGVRGKLCRIARVDPGTSVAILLGGSGTAAVEAALGSLVPRGGRVLIVENGAYGARAVEIAGRLGIAAVNWRLPWTQRPDAADFRGRLEAGEFTHAFWVHHETTTGMLNPLESFASACRSCGVGAIVDAMSSFAGIDVDWGALNVDAVVSSANKCIQGLPGASFVIARRSALAASEGAARSLALDLHLHAAEQERRGEFPFTAPVQVIWALDRALDEATAESVAVRSIRYCANYERLTGGLESRGIHALLPREWHSRLLTAYREPEWPGFSFEALHDFLRERGITIYPGKVPGLRSFRLGHIGALTPQDQETVLAALDDFLALCRTP